MSPGQDSGANKNAVWSPKIRTTVLNYLKQKWRQRYRQNKERKVEKEKKIDR
jgi:hypothetical protein